MRSSWTLGLLIVAVAACDTGSPAETLYAPDDLAAVLPREVGAVTLQVEGQGGSEYLAESLGAENLTRILHADGGIGYDPDKLHFALASSSPGRDDPRLIIFAVRVEGIPADALGPVAGNQVWDALTDLGPWTGYASLYRERRIGEVLFGAVVTAGDLDITYDDVQAALPT